MAVHIFIKQVPKRPVACRDTRLRAKRAQPHEITRANAPAGFKGDDVEMHIVAQIGRVGKPLRRPFVSARHVIERHVIIMGDDRVGRR